MRQLHRKVGSISARAWANFDFRDLQSTGTNTVTEATAGHLLDIVSVGDETVANNS